MEAANSRYYYDSNSTLTEEYLEDLMPKSEIGGISQGFLDANSELLKFLEHAYNLLHLFSICILPYSIELFCYAVILLLMKRVNKDIRKERSGNRCRSLFCCSRSDKTEDVGRRSGLLRCCSGETPGYGTKFRLLEGGASVCVDKDVVTTTEFSSTDHRVIEYRTSTANEDCTGKKSAVAWKNTVALARRKTRRKAFLMLTLNMIFWTPYCVMGMLSAVMIFDHSAYNFVNAFVVLNAVSNLLL